MGSPLSAQVGSTVEVKTNEGVSSEAVISKLTDASLYTVGESLCLTAGLIDHRSTEAGVSCAGWLAGQCVQTQQVEQPLVNSTSSYNQ